MLKNFWYACEFSHVVNNQPKQIELWGENIVLYRNSANEVVALKDICPHRGAALSLGKVEKDCIHCPYHGWKFREDGTCIEIPANPAGVSIPNKARTKTYFVREKYGFIWLFWGELPPEKCPPLPTLSDLPDSFGQPIYLNLKFKAHYSRVLENLVDPVHTAFVHTNSIGSGMVKEPQILTTDEICVEEWSANCVVIAKQPALKKGLYWKYIYDRYRTETKVLSAFYLPNLVLLNVDFKFNIIQHMCLVPINENTTEIKLIGYRNFLTYFWADSLFRQVNLKILKDDKRVVESQIPEVVPNDLAAELNVAGDGISIAYRKLRQKYLKIEQETNSF